MDRVLSAALREATYAWLDRLEMLVREADLPSRAALAETELMRSVTAWRALLAEHEPDEEGRCRRCAGWRWRRRRSCPCSVWVTVHRCLVVNDTLGYDGARHARRPDQDTS
jgi:hypothetical protein